MPIIKCKANAEQKYIAEYHWMLTIVIGDIFVQDTVWNLKIEQDILEILETSYTTPNISLYTGFLHNLSSCSFFWCVSGLPDVCWLIWSFVSITY